MLQCSSAPVLALVVQLGDWIGDGRPTSRGIGELHKILSTDAVIRPHRQVNHPPVFLAQLLTTHTLSALVVPAITRARTRQTALGDDMRGLRSTVHLDKFGETCWGEAGLKRDSPSRILGSFYNEVQALLSNTARMLWCGGVSPAPILLDWVLQVGSRFSLAVSLLASVR